MPGKHVRFARTLTVHSPPTPALTTSSFSPASSGAVLTPPSRSNTMPGPSPYTYAVMQPPAVTLIHVLLQPSHSPALIYDVTQPPSTVTSYQRGISMRVLTEPATKPPMSSMTIVNSQLPWAISIYPTSGSYVTVQDVLDGVYRKLRTGTSSKEFYALLTSERERRRVTMAYEKRYRGVRGSSREYEDEKRGGVRRSDFLGGRTRFLGLSPTEQGDRVWHLDTA